MMQVLFITGRAQSGKDTSYDNMIQYMDCNKFFFADPLKKFCINVLGLDHSQCYGTNEEKDSLTNLKWCDLPIGTDVVIQKLMVKLDWQHKNTPYKECRMSGREVMQVFGTNIVRKFYPDSWAKGTLNNILNHQEVYGDILSVITDARFPNEIEVFREYNPYIIRLTRNPINSNHQSETALDDYEWWQFENAVIIDNSEMTLEEKNNAVIEQLRNWRLL